MCLQNFKKRLRISFVMFVQPSIYLGIHMEHPCSDLMDFHEIWYFIIFQNCWENSSVIKIWQE
jgi:hypothetical protein